MIEFHQNPGKPINKRVEISIAHKQNLKSFSDATILATHDRVCHFILKTQDPTLTCGAWRIASIS